MRIACFVLSFTLCLSSVVTAQDRVLPAPEVSVEATIGGSDIHTYRVTSSGHELLHVVAVQQGVDVVVTLAGPGGVSRRVDSPNEDQGPEPLEALLSEPGEYRLTIAPLEPTAAAGRYTLTVRERRPERPADGPRLAVAPGRPLGELRLAIERITKSINATWGIYLKALDTNEEILINADAVMDTMSVIKIPLMIEVFEQAKAGRLRLDDRYTITAADKRPGTGTLQLMDPGAVVTIKDLVTYMIIVSDNTATDILYRLVGGPAAVTARMRSYGLTTTAVTADAAAWFAQFKGRGMGGADEADAAYRERTWFAQSTPREIATLLERMALGTVVDAQASATMIGIMRWQQFSSRIPRYLANRGSVPHKTGDYPPYIQNDVGMFELPTGRRVVLSVFTADHFGETYLLEEAIGRIADRVTAHFTNR